MLTLVVGLCVVVALWQFVLVGRRIANMLGAETAQLHREIVKLTPLEAMVSHDHDHDHDHGSVLYAWPNTRVQKLGATGLNAPMPRWLPPSIAPYPAA